MPVWPAFSTEKGVTGGIESLGLLVRLAVLLSHNLFITKSHKFITPFASSRIRSRRRSTVHDNIVFGLMVSLQGGLQLGYRPATGLAKLEVLPGSSLLFDFALDPRAPGEDPRAPGEDPGVFGASVFGSTISISAT